MNVDARLNAQLAALAAGVSKQTFNYWRSSGKILPAEDGTYSYIEVMRVEAAMRRSSKSHRKPQRWALLDRNSSGLPVAS
jgi:hypothetical protein